MSLARSDRIPELTFAALHLACMRLISTIVPQRLAATAQAIYALGAGATTALLTLASGWLYATLGAQGFLMMALLCAAATGDVGTARRSLALSCYDPGGYDVVAAASGEGSSLERPSLRPRRR